MTDSYRHIADACMPAMRQVLATEPWTGVLVDSYGSLKATFQNV